MSQAPSVALAGTTGDSHVAAPADAAAHVAAEIALRGTTRGLEIVVTGAPSAEALSTRLAELLAEAPGFFAGSHARVAVDGALPLGALASLEQVAARFALQIVEIGPAQRRRRRDLAPVANAAAAALAVIPAAPGHGEVSAAKLAEGSGPVADDATGAARRSTGPGDPGVVAALAAVLVAAGAASRAEAASAALAAAGAASQAEAVDAAPSGPRLVIGPVRSGRIVDHVGHLIVIGDVNPGAEVRAEGSIIVLGRLRGVAHAAIGRDAGCIIALSLSPQQLRIGRMVARAADADRPGGGAEIAYATGETIVVERFLGRLPSGLAASM